MSGKNISYLGTLIDLVERGHKKSAQRLAQKKYGAKLGKKSSEFQRKKLEDQLLADYYSAVATFREPDLSIDQIEE